MTNDKIEDWATRFKPRTWRERALVWAALAVYREQRSLGASPTGSWDRVTDLVDETLVRPVRYAEERDVAGVSR